MEREFARERQRQGAAQATLEALMFSLRQRWIAALAEPMAETWLSSCRRRRLSSAWCKSPRARLSIRTPMICWTLWQTDIMTRTPEDQAALLGDRRQPMGGRVRTTRRTSSDRRWVRLPGGTEKCWLRCASTTAPGTVWVAGVPPHGPWLLSLDHAGVAAELTLNALLHQAGLKCPL